MKRGFRGVPRPLLPAMLPVVVVNQSAGQVDQAVDQPSPSEPLPSSSHPPVLSAMPESEPTPVAEQITHPTSLTPEPDSEPIEHTFEQPSPEHQPLSPRQETEITKVDSLETELKQTKLTMGKSLVKLVKKTPTQGKTSEEEDTAPHLGKQLKLLSKDCFSEVKVIEKVKDNKREKSPSEKELVTLLRH
ncbi:hypothetical protein Tco_0312849 [Tanacetum coccineum]